MTIELGASFDAAKYIKSEEGQRELIRDAFASGDSRYIKHAIGIIARAQGGISELAKRSGIGRQSLHKALSDKGNPTLDTLLRVTCALHARLTVVPESVAKEMAEA